MFDGEAITLDITCCLFTTSKSLSEKRFHSLFYEEIVFKFALLVKFHASSLRPLLFLLVRMRQSM